MISLTLSRLYYFLFFNCVYAFLTFWIGATYFYRIWPFFIGGLFFYLFAFLFQKAVLTMTQEHKSGVKVMGAILFFAIVIPFLAIYLAGVYFIQDQMIKNSSFPPVIFTIVSMGMSIFSLIVSFLLSFNKKSSNQTVQLRKANRIA